MGGILLFPVVFIITKVLFLKIFQQCQLAPPALTKLFVSVPTTVYLLFTLVIVFVLLIKELLISDKKTKLIINIAAAIAASIFVLVYAVAFIVPLISLLVKLQENS